MDKAHLQHTQLFRTPAGAAAAVTRVRQNEHDFYLLNSLSNLTADPECWLCLRDAGIVDLFLDMILRMPRQASGDLSSVPLWALPLQGLFNGMVGIQRSPGAFKGPENHEATSKILKESPAICRRLSEEKEVICGFEPHAEDLRRSLVLWIQAIWNGAAMLSLAEVRRELKSSRVIDLTTWCWLFASSVELRSRAATALADVLEQPQSTKADLDQVIASSGSYGRLISENNIVLRNADTVDEYLANSMSLLTGFTGQTVHVELARQFAKMHTHHEVMDALRRQLRRSDGGEEAWRVLEYSGMLIVNIVNEAASPTEELTSLISHNSLTPLMGGVLLRCAQSSRQSASWSSLITLLKHTCTCTSQSCRVRTSPAYVSALRTHLSWRWLPTLKKLRAITSESSAKIQSEWIILGRMAGLDEMTERKKQERGDGVQGCWWVECVNLVEPSDPVKNLDLRKCSGCKKALYCTTDCQNRDWKAHKKQCMAWKSPVAAH